MIATALCNFLFSVEGIGYYKIPKNIWPSFFLLQKIKFLFDKDDLLSVQTWNLSNVLYQFQGKRIICDVFWQQLENGGCSTHLF